MSLVRAMLWHRHCSAVPWCHSHQCKDIPSTLPPASQIKTWQSRNSQKWPDCSHLQLLLRSRSSQLTAWHTAFTQGIKLFYGADVTKTLTWISATTISQKEFVPHCLNVTGVNIHKAWKWPCNLVFCIWEESHFLLIAWKWQNFYGKETTRYMNGLQSWRLLDKWSSFQHERSYMGSERARLTSELSQMLVNCFPYPSN